MASNRKRIVADEDVQNTPNVQPIYSHDDDECIILYINNNRTQAFIAKLDNKLSTDYRIIQQKRGNWHFTLSRPSDLKTQ